jgi:hypothetical protein
MSLARLKQRTPSAKRCGSFKLLAHSLRFHKVGQDKSGKCDAFYTANQSDYVLGALFEIDEVDKIYLDKAEGLGFGYDEKEVTLLDSQNQVISAFLYIATHIDAEIKPYSWYKNHVLIGALESNLTEEYIDKIKSVKSFEDLDKNRNALQRAIHN